MRRWRSTSTAIFRSISRGSAKCRRSAATSWNGLPAPREKPTRAEAARCARAFDCIAPAYPCFNSNEGRGMARQTLLIDADDTLWENNIFFEKAIDHFITQLEHLGYTRDYIRHILNETEKRNIRQHGYGVRSFKRSLEDTYLKLAGNAARREIVQEIERMAVELEATPPHILEGVPETLAYLAKHHRLILL